MACSERSGGRLPEKTKKRIEGQWVPFEDSNVIHRYTYFSEQQLVGRRIRRYNHSLIRYCAKNTAAR